MSRRSLWFVLGLGLWGASPLTAALPIPAPEPLVWRPKDQKLDVQIRGWPLHRFLEHLARQTGWQIFIEPETTGNISTQFTDRPVGEALQAIFGTLSFALIPQDKGPSKLFVFRTGLKQATKKIEPPAPGTEPIPNELIVKLKPGASIDDLAKLLGARVTGRADELNLYRLEFDDEESAKRARTTLKDRQEVASVENNYQIPQPSQIDPLALNRALPLELRPKAVGSADQIIVGLVDTPIQRTGTAWDGFLLSSISVAGDAAPPDGVPTHATAMMETILRGLSLNTRNGPDSPVRILPVDVYGNNEYSSTYNVAVGITKAINSGAMIINLSLGSPSQTAYLDQVIQSGYDQGVLFLAAAGNEPTDAPTYPAANPIVIAVTAGDRDGNISPYANRGSFVDIIAPGSTVVSYRGANWYVAGTSAATAWSTGFAASLASPGGDYKKIGAALRQALGSRAK